MKNKFYKTIIVLLLVASSVGFSTHMESIAEDATNPVEEADSFVIQLIKDYYVSKGEFPDDGPAFLEFAKHSKQKFDIDKLFYNHEGFSDFLYIFRRNRPDGSPLSSPRPKGSLDVIAYRFVSSPSKTSLILPNGAKVFASDFSSRSVPYDLMYYNYIDENRYTFSFPMEAKVSEESLNYSESWLKAAIAPEPPNSKIVLGIKDIVNDNGGPESLVRLSRCESYPDIYGISFEELWKTFDPAQAEFTLADVQAGATKLGLDTQVQKQSLAQLQKSGSPALLFLKDDGRIVTLSSLDDDRAVVVDRGLTRNVERSVLEARYSGEALVPTKALTQQTGVVADDAVRSLQLKSLDEEVPQQVTLRNTGQKPVTLQLEYPLLGVTESKLSKDTLAPGESATLDLKVKWRSILKAPTQNVLVSLQTSDPIVPRLQLAILLSPPQAAAK